MMRIHRHLLAMLALVFCTGSLPAEDLPAELITRINRVAAELIEQTGAPGLSLAVARDNQLQYAQAYGLADVENEVPVSVDTRFRTASIAKSMTAVLILSLVEDGLVDLDAEVQTYVPEYPSKQWPVTSRQLLGHLGGVRHYQHDAETRSTRHFFSLDAALTTFADDPLLHQPGTKYLYSTFGYNLLGSVAEGAGKSNYLTLLQDKVLTPAGMTATVADSQHALIPGRSRGYIKATASLLRSLPDNHDLQLGEIYHAALHDTSMKIPGGGLLSTPSDLIRFATAVNRGRLLHADTCQQMWTRQTTRDGQPTNYGLGWRIDQHAGRQVVLHTGGQAGTSTVLILFPETGVSVALMCNLQSVALTPTAKLIADILQPARPPVDYDAAIEKLRHAVQYEVAAKDIPALSIAIVDDQRPVWSAGFGFLDAEKQQPATAESVYRVGSISKLLTDMAIMQLVEQGQLDLDAPVQTYLPDFQPQNPFGVALTLRQLMTHRSGLVRESPIGNYFDPTEPTLADTVASLNGTRLVYRPDTKTKYSNAAVAVVGAALESQLRVSHAEHVRTAILEPLAMRHSSFVATPETQARQATGWMRTYDGRRFAAPTFHLGTGPAGNLYSSVVDLSKLLTCMFGEGTAAGQSILKPETYRQMITPGKQADGSPQAFGIGFHVQRLDDYTKIGHGGAIYGFSTQLEALPQRKLGVCAAASLDGSNGLVERLSDYALRLMLATQDGQPLPDYETTEPIPPARVTELLGSYQATTGEARVHVDELAGQVTLQRGSLRYDLRSATSDGRLVTDDVVGYGTPVELVEPGRLTIAGQAFERLPETPPAAAPDRWQGLIGEYGWDHNVLYILEDGGQLVALIEWFYYYPLTEVDQDTYRFPDYGLYHGEGLKFQRDAQGNATHVVAAEVQFDRRPVGTQGGETFKITPLRPIDDLRAAAMAAQPPREQGDFRAADLVDLTTLDPTIQLDIRYATTNNFTGAVFYKQPRAFMQRPAAQAVAQANGRLQTRGLGLLVHDAYRPWHVTKMFWDATPDALKDFVANPAGGSRHNRGCAVDLTLYDLQTGAPIEMVAGYDEFSPRSFPWYPGGTARGRWYRQLLRRTMEAAGFSIYEYEWWHFDYRDWKAYPIGNLTFEEID